MGPNLSVIKQPQKMMHPSFVLPLMLQKGNPLNPAWLGWSAVNCSSIEDLMGGEMKTDRE